MTLSLAPSSGLRLARRALLVVGLAFAGALILGVLRASPASAVTRPVIHVTDKPQTVTEGPMIGNNPNNVSADPAPSDCSDPFTYCDQVPLEITAPPGTTVFDTWFAEIVVSWDRSQPGGCDKVDTPAASTTPCNDIDVYAYDDGQIAKSGAYTGLSSSTTSDVPEKLSIFNPILVKYNLVINNYLGANKGYTVSIHTGVFKGVRPVELLAPGATGDSATPSAIADGSAAPFNGSSGAPPVAYGANGPALDIAPIAPDSAFSDFPVPIDQFNAPAKGPLLLDGLLAATAKPPGAPSLVLILLTMILLPAVLVGGGLGWALKKRRSAFSL